MTKVLESVYQWLQAGAPHQQSKDSAFTMAYWRMDKDVISDEVIPYSDDLNACGTVMCIGGAIEQFDPLKRSAFQVITDELGILDDGLYGGKINGLFYPYSEEKYTNEVDYEDELDIMKEEAYNATPKQAAKVLRNFIDNKEVDWSLINHE